MIPLTNNSSTTSQSLVITLGGAATTTYPTVTVSSYVIPQQSRTLQGSMGQITGDPSEYRSANEFTLLTTASETTIATAPISGQIKCIFNICVYNADTVASIVTIAIDDNGTNRVQVKQSLDPGESLIYEGGRAGIGWHII